MPRTRIDPLSPKRKRRRRPQVLTLLVDAPELPWITPAHRYNCLTISRPADWTTFGFEFCQQEENRRKQIFDHATRDEINLLTEYWRLRDD